MKVVLFIGSVSALLLSVYFLVADFTDYSDTNHWIYIVLLVIVLFNGLAGIKLTLPQSFIKHKKTTGHCGYEAHNE